MILIELSLENFFTKILVNFSRLKYFFVNDEKYKNGRQFCVASIFHGVNSEQQVVNYEHLVYSEFENFWSKEVGRQNNQILWVMPKILVLNHQ